MLRKYGYRLITIVALFWAVGSAESARADIYLNGVSGNDASNGLSVVAAVQTFPKAKQLLATQGAGIIKVTGQVTISSDTVLSFSNTGDGVSIGWPGAMVQRDASYTGILFYNGQSNNSLTLTNIVIDVNAAAVTATNGPLIYMENYASSGGNSLTIQQDAVLRNNTSAFPDTTGGGAIKLKGRNNFLMSGGAISNNAAVGTPSTADGGGIFLPANFTGTFEMTGGRISGNTATRMGGRHRMLQFNGHACVVGVGGDLRKSGKKLGGRHRILCGDAHGANERTGRRFQQLHLRKLRRSQCDFS